MSLKHLWSTQAGPVSSRDPHAPLCREECVWHCARPLRHGGTMKAMSSPGSRRFPVTVTRLPVTPCQIRHRTVVYRPGSLREVLTEHYRRATTKRSASRPRWPVPQTTPSADAAGAVLPAEGGLSAWAAQMTSVATERDPAMVLARAQSRRYLQPEFGCLRCSPPRVFCVLLLRAGPIT
jgi:hypothetical protein